MPNDEKGTHLWISQKTTSYQTLIKKFLCWNLYKYKDAYYNGLSKSNGSGTFMGRIRLYLSLHSIHTEYRQLSKCAHFISFMSFDLTHFHYLF